jgi:protoheme IX farnesyltransferase
VAPNAAFVFGLSISLAGMLLLVGLVGPEPAALAAIAWAVYVLVYTPLKRRTPWAVLVGAVPGALPPVIGWVGLAPNLDAQAASLFVLLYAWQLPHFLAIAVYRVQDYRRAGLAVWPAVYGVAATRRMIVAAAVVLLVASMLPYWVGLASAVYLSVAATLGLGYVLLALSGLRRTGTEKRWARQVFLASLPHLVLVLGALLVAAE